MPRVGTQGLPRLSASDCVAAARKLLETERLLLAKKALDIAAACARKETKGAALAETVRDLRKQLDQKQDEMLAEADKALKAGKALEALTRYHTYARKFGGLRIGKSAAEKIAQARKSPELRSIEKRAASAAAYAEVEALIEEQWRRMRPPARADAPAPSRPPDHEIVAAMSIEKQAAVLQALRDVLSDPEARRDGTPAAAKAAALDKKLRADADLIAAVEKWRAEREARALFLKGCLYESANAKKKAAATYRLLVDKHPACKYAALARSRLKNLR